MTPRPIFLVLISVSIFVLSGQAFAQQYPSRLIRLVVPYSAGGGTDIVTRQFARELEKSIGQTIIVENRAGAGGLIGTQAVINAEPDGYTLLVGDNSTNSFVPALAKVPRYDPVVDLTPISLLLDVPNVLVAHPSLGATDLPGLIALAKAKPGALNAGTAGVGSFAHVATELMNVLAGTKIICVAYKGGAEALPAILKGEVQIEIMPVRNALPYIENGQLKALAVTSKSRALLLANVPSISETLKDYSAENWYGLYAPAKLPESILSKLANAIDAAQSSKAMQDVAKDNGTRIRKTSPAEFKLLAHDDYVKWAKLINDVGIPKN